MSRKKDYDMQFFWKVRLLGDGPPPTPFTTAQIETATGVVFPTVVLAFFTNNSDTEVAAAASAADMIGRYSSRLREL